MRKIFLVCLVIAALPCFAQESGMKSAGLKKERRKERIDSLMKQEEEGVITYPKQIDFGVKLVSDGYGIFMDIGRAKSIKRSLLYQVEIGERKSAKETKQTNPAPDDPSASPVIIGKENFFYYTKMGVQEQFLLANKANKNGVNITCNVGGGLSLAILRPYQYEVYDESVAAYKYVSFNTLVTDSSDFLEGGPSLAQGWDDLSLTPGVYGKAAVRFDYGHYTRTVTALEIGLSGEYYTKSVPILFGSDPKQLFFSAYAAILFGLRRK
ncbi:MAG TPA: hypothetical protein VK718_02515 [Ferruginibacter sp.]|jgi:hypothetical protein|nr:hypothetical protein [Ferruginibacter sp.]